MVGAYGALWPNLKFSALDALLSSYTFPCLTTAHRIILLGFACMALPKV